MEDTEKEIAEFLELYGPEMREFAQALRVHLKGETKPTVELAGQSAQSFNIGYGFTTTAWDCFCAIIVYRKHINISFPSGASLSDPGGLLHGTGSRVRHLKIKELRDVQTPAVKKLLKEARRNALRAAKLREGDLPQGVNTVIKRKEKGR